MTTNPRWLSVAMCGTVLSGLLLITVAHSAGAVPKPVIIDTDVGSFIDDSAAILLALQNPELDVKLIVTATNDTTARARIVAKYLMAVNRTDIPIGIGVAIKPTLQSMYGWAADIDLDKYSQHYGGKILEDGVQAMNDVIMTSSVPVEIIAIAPATNFPSLLKRFPGVVSRVGHVWAMSGSFHRGYRNSTTPVAEYNVALCAECSQAMYAAGWPITTTPLDTCGVAYLPSKSFSRLLTGNGPHSSIFVESWLYWCPRNSLAQCSLNPLNSDDLMDAVATTLATSTSSKFLTISKENVTITSDGHTVLSQGPGSVEVNVALQWNGGDAGLEAFRLWLAEQIAGPTTA